MVGSAVAATAVTVSKCSNDDVVQMKGIVIVANGLTYNIPYTEANANELLVENRWFPDAARTTTFTDDQGQEINIKNAEITQFVLGQDFADAYGNTLPDKFAKDFFAHST